MISKDLLEILCCPETHQSLREATQEEVKTLRAGIKARTLHNRAGQTIEGELDGALVREDNRMAYPIRSGIPTLLVDEAIEL